MTRQAAYNSVERAVFSLLGRRHREGKWDKWMNEGRRIHGDSFAKRLWRQPFPIYLWAMLGTWNNEWVISTCQWEGAHEPTVYHFLFIYFFHLLSMSWKYKESQLASCIWDVKLHPVYDSSTDWGALVTAQNTQCYLWLATARQDWESQTLHP